MTDPDRPPPDDPASGSFAAPLAAPLGTLFDALDALLADEAARHARLDEPPATPSTAHVRDSCATCWPRACAVDRPYCRRRAPGSDREEP